MSSISIAEGSDLRYQGVVRFDVDPGKLKGNQWPLVYVAAYGDDDALIYGELTGMRGVTDGFIVTLGGGSSIWVNERPGTPAHCTATLYAYSKSGDIERLAGPIEFDAAGG